MDQRAVAVLAVAPFITLSGVLRQLPDCLSYPWAMPWVNSVGHSTLLLGLMGAHAWCYARWQPHAPNRILVNEFLTRLWFVVFGLLAVGSIGTYGGLFLVMASAWAVASWCTYYLVFRQQEAYRPGVNTAILGLFLLGLALIALICVKLDAADAAASALA